MTKKGFAALSPERRREIASMGGRAGAPENRHFAKNRQAAKAAGKLGGKSKGHATPKPEGHGL